MTTEEIKRKKWRTKSGLNARFGFERKHDTYPYCFLVYFDDDDDKNEDYMWYTKDLNYNNLERCGFDLVEVSPYEDYKIDEKVICWNNNVYDYKKRHFAGLKDNNPTAYSEGTTSWSTENHALSIYKWDNCLKVEDFIKQYPSESKELGLL